MIEWILSSSVLICAVLVLRLIFRSRISTRLQYALWFFVLLRLLFPGSLVESSASVGSLLSPMTDAPIIQAASGHLTEQGRYDHAVQEVLTQQDYPPEIYSILPEVRQEAILTQYQPQIHQKMETYQRAYRAAQVLKILWLTGIAAIGIALVISNLRFRGKLRRFREKLDVDSPLTVYRCSAVPSPCLFGFFRPEIYLPPDAISDKESLICILAHELTHYRHWDHIWSAARCVCLMLHWYNPLVWVALRLSRRDMELACDEGTLEKLGDSSRDCYGRTLIAMSGAPSSPRDYLLTATTMTGDKKSLRQRIRFIAKKPKFLWSALILLVVITACIIGFTFTGATANPSPAESTEPADTVQPENPSDAPTTLPPATVAPETTAPTAPSYHEISADTPMVRMMGMLYVQDTVSDENTLHAELPQDYVYLGICYEDNERIPKLDGYSMHIPSFTEFYASPKAPDYIYYDTGSGYQQMIRAALLNLKVSKDDPDNTAPEDFLSAFFSTLLQWHSQNPYNQVGRLVFTQPEDVDLYQLFYNGFPEWSHRAVPLTDGEKAFLASHGWNEDKPMSNAERYPISAMDQHLQRFFGITFAQSNQVGLDRMENYREENQCYYHWLSDVRGFRITILSIDYQPDTGLYHIFYQCDAELYPEVYHLTLKQNQHVLQILSNVLSE